jgi:hypothetical protein
MWNIGTIARTRSVDDSPTASPLQIAVGCRLTERASRALGNIGTKSHAKRAISAEPIASSW